MLPQISINHRTLCNTHAHMSMTMSSTLLLLREDPLPPQSIILQLRFIYQVHYVPSTSASVYVSAIPDRVGQSLLGNPLFLSSSLPFGGRTGKLLPLPFDVLLHARPVHRQSIVCLNETTADRLNCPETIGMFSEVSGIRTVPDERCTKLL